MSVKETECLTHPIVQLVGEIEFKRGQWQQFDLSHFEALGEATRVHAARALSEISQCTRDAMPEESAGLEAKLLVAYSYNQSVSATSADSIEALYDFIAIPHARWVAQAVDFTYWASICRVDEIHPLINACNLHCVLTMSKYLTVSQKRLLAFLLQYRVLNEWEPRFVAVPIAEYVHEHLDEYSRAVFPGDRPSAAIEFLLNCINKLMDGVYERVVRSVEGAEDVGIQTDVVPLRPLERRLLELFKDPESEYMTLVEAAKQLNCSASTAERMSLTLKKRGMLERLGSKRGGYWRVIEQ